MIAKKIAIFVLCFIILSCSATYYTPPPRKHPGFMQDNVLKLKQGMTTNEVISLFGKPDMTSVHTYGHQTHSGEWQGLEYTYVFNYIVSNRLVFSLAYDPPLLNHWDIVKTWD